MFYCFGAAGWIFLCVFRGERRNGNLIQLVVVGLFNDKCWEGGSLCLPPVAWLSVIWLKEILYKKLKVRAGRSPSQHVPFSGGSLSATSLPFLQQEIIPGLGQRPATAKPRGFAGFVSKSSSLLASFGIVVPFPKGFFFSGCFSPKKAESGENVVFAPSVWSVREGDFPRWGLWILEGLSTKRGRDSILHHLPKVCPAPSVPPQGSAFPPG